MKVTLKQALDAATALSALGDKELPIDLSFLVSRVAIKLAGETRPFPESRMALFRKHGHKVEGGMEIPPERQVVFQADMAALFATEIEIGEIDPLPWPDIWRALKEAGEGFKANYILAMDWLLNFEEKREDD